MRLINIQTLKLEEFTATSLPPYAIFSHRWEGGEITYEDFIDPNRRHGSGFDKIERFCAFLRKWRHAEVPDNPLSVSDWQDQNNLDGVQWAWVDTCCIDRRSSAELSESINSMWIWYKRAQLCVAYMSDVSTGEGWKKEFSTSVWFTRGWTLQELLAPERIWFCNKSWQVLGKKDCFKPDRHCHELVSFNELLSSASRIPQIYLEGVSIHGASIAQRMSWVSRRETTRVEDMAYCLFGLFGINLPLLYGEGNLAFQRLQEQIIQASDDESIFAWNLNHWAYDTQGAVLAPHPRYFIDCESILRCSLVRRKPYEVTNKGIKFRSRMTQVQENKFLIRLNCAEFCDALPLNKWELRSRKARGCVLWLSRSRDRSFVRAPILDPDFEVFNPRMIEEETIFLRHNAKVDAQAVSLDRVELIDDGALMRSYERAYLQRIQGRKTEAGSFFLDGDGFTRRRKCLDAEETNRKRRKMATDSNSGHDREDEEEEDQEEQNQPQDSFGNDASYESDATTTHSARTNDNSGARTPDPLGHLFKSETIDLGPPDILFPGVPAPSRKISRHDQSVRREK